MLPAILAASLFQSRVRGERGGVAIRVIVNSVASMVVVSKDMTGARWFGQMVRHAIFADAFLALAARADCCCSLFLAG